MKATIAHLADTVASKGLLDTASPLLLVLGGLLLALAGVGLLIGAKRVNEDSEAHWVLSWVGWVAATVGVVGIYQGVFGG
jgi:uncharacterized membrane protein YfcA